MFSIRKFKPSDFEKVIEIEEEVFGESNPLLFMMAYDSSSDGFLVAANDGRTIGFINGIVSASDEVRILSLGVSTMYQNRGIATALLREFIEIYRAKGFVSIKLEVRVSNFRAQKLYISQGFNTVKIIPSYYTDGEDGFQMVKLLV